LHRLEKIPDHRVISVTISLVKNMNPFLEPAVFDGSWQNPAFTMRVAIAGSGGLACWIAHYLSTETFHPFIILSRAVGSSVAPDGGRRAD
jgi:hypothetical protein